MSELGLMLTLEYGQALPAHIRSGYGFPVFGSNGEVGRHRKFLISEPGIVVGRKGSVGKVTWSDEPFWPIDTTYWVRCEIEDRRWLYWVLTWLPLDRLDTSTGVPGLNRNDVYSLTVDRPRLKERQRIAQVLDTLDTAISGTEALIAKLKAVKQGLLHDLLTRGIDANGELRPPQVEAPHLYKMSPLGWIPKEWDVKQLHEVGETVTGTTPPSIDPLAWGSGTPFITPSEITDDRPISESERQVSARGLRYVRLLPAKTIVVVCIGSTIGKVGITATSSCTNQQINAVLPYEGVYPEYLFLAIRMHIGQLRGLAGLQAVPIVNKTSFESIWVPLARPSEQIEMAKRHDSISTRINDEDAILNKLRLEKAGLMDDLLTGRVRVTPLLAESPQQKGSA